VDKRPEKYKGFDPYIQDAFKVLPLSTKTRFAGNLDLRSLKGYTRWRKLEYLPSSVIDFADKLHNSALEEYPIMFQSYLFDLGQIEDQQYELHLNMADKIGSNDLMDEPLLWYSDHSFLLPTNHYFDKIYSEFHLNTQLKNTGPDALMVGYFNPIGLTLNELIELFKNKDEASKTAVELTSFTFASKIDLSGAIDTWRHTRSNRMVQPIYHALENDPKVSMPELHKRQLSSGNEEIPVKSMEVSEDAVRLYSKLVDEGVPSKEAVNVLPHNLELIQIEMMDIFSFLNIMAIRTCIHARPEVQTWAKALLREIALTPDFRGLDHLSEEQSNLLARGIVFGYCAELGTCKKCGPEVVYLPDPFR
jgi:thymidylate synthase ThyX